MTICRKAGRMRLIDADALKLSMTLIAPGETKEYCYPCREILKAIDDASTIEERKTGTWQRKYSRPGVYADLCWHCSICGGKFSDTYANMWKHCPDCGADMRGEQDETD